MGNGPIAAAAVVSVPFSVLRRGRPAPHPPPPASPSHIRWVHCQAIRSPLASAQGLAASASCSADPFRSMPSQTRHVRCRATRLPLPSAQGLAAWASCAPPPGPPPPLLPIWYADKPPGRPFLPVKVQWRGRRAPPPPLPLSILLSTSRTRLGHAVSLPSCQGRPVAPHLPSRFGDVGVVSTDPPPPLPLCLTLSSTSMAR